MRPFRERLRSEEDQGILGLAVAEDKALLRSNLQRRGGPVAWRRR